MKNFWNERYSTKDYIYGTQPNQFFKEQIEKLNAGKILMVGEGEGRNAVYAAKLGWQVDAIDSSSVAKDKALMLAERNKVSINYQVADIHSYNFPDNIYDAVGIRITKLPIKSEDVLKKIKEITKSKVIVE